MTIRKPKVGLGVGLAVSALAGAPMPLPQLALIGPWLAASAAGALGARVSAAIGLVSFFLFGHPTLITGFTALGIAILIAWGVPNLIDDSSQAPAEHRSKGGASAVVVNCEGFAALDDSYGSGASDHVFKLLRRALEIETRDADLVVHAREQELILILEGSNPQVAQSVMGRVEKRFSGWLEDAGYECNLSVGMATLEEGEAEFENLMRATRRHDGDRYLD